VRPLEAAGLLAAPLSATPGKWRGVALLPLRAGADVNAGSSSGGWLDVGDRMRDIRAGRGRYVRLDLRYTVLLFLGLFLTGHRR
jgi:DNA polymerase beta